MGLTCKEQEHEDVNCASISPANKLVGTLDFAQTFLFSFSYFLLHPPIVLSYMYVGIDSESIVNTELYNTWPVSLFQLMHTEL